MRSLWAHAENNRPLGAARFESHNLKAEPRLGATADRRLGHRGGIPGGVADPGGVGQTRW